MVRADGSRTIGQSYLLPNAEADRLIAQGIAKLPEQLGKPSEFKPAPPLEVKQAVTQASIAPKK